MLTPEMIGLTVGVGAVGGAAIGGAIALLRSNNPLGAGYPGLGWGGFPSKRQPSGAGIPKATHVITPFTPGPPRDSDKALTIASRIATGTRARVNRIGNIRRITQSTRPGSYADMPKNPVLAMVYGWDIGMRQEFVPGERVKGFKGAMKALGQWALGGPKYKTIEQVASSRRLLEKALPMDMWAEVQRAGNVYKPVGTPVGSLSRAEYLKDLEKNRYTIAASRLQMLRGGKPMNPDTKKALMNRTTARTGLRLLRIGAGAAAASALLPGGFGEFLGASVGWSAGYAFGALAGGGSPFRKATKMGEGAIRRGRGMFGLGKMRTKMSLGARARGGFFGSLGAAAGMAIFGGKESLPRRAFGRVQRQIMTAPSERRMMQVTPTYSLEQGGYPGAPVFGPYTGGAGRI